MAVAAGATRVCRAAVEERQIRGGVSARQRDGQRSPTGIGTLPDILQPDQAALGA